NGGGQTAVPPRDVLSVVGGSGFKTLRYKATGGGAGDLLLDGSSPITLTDPQPNSVPPPTAPATLAIPDPKAHTPPITSPGNGLLAATLDGGLEALTLANPTAKLELLADPGSDTFTIDSLDAEFRASLLVAGSAGTDDAFNLNAPLLLGSATSAGNLTV